jgi:hypothetical protein
MRMPWVRAKPVPRFAPQAGWEVELLAASEAADDACAALAEALARHRRAAVMLGAETRFGSQAALNRLLSPYAIGSGFWAAGSGDKSLAELVSSPFVGAVHRRTFAQMTRAAIEQTRAGRRPVASLSQSEPAAPGEPQEA